VYCEQIKKDGSDDIDAWTIDELKQAIANFKKKEE
jgi:predicted transcriptional regulator